MPTTQQVCTFFLEGSYFGIAVEAVQEVIQQQPMTRVPLAPIDVCGLMNLRGQIIPVVDLPGRIGIRAAACAVADDRTTYNIIVRSNEDVVSFLVDDIGDVLDCAIADFEPPPVTLDRQIRSFLQGAYKLERDFLLMLDTPKILEQVPASY